MWLGCGFVGDLFFLFCQFLTQNVTVRMVGVVRLQRQRVQTSISPRARLPHQAFSETVYLIDHSSVQHWIPSILKQLGEWVSDSDFSANTPLKCEVESFSLFSTGTKLNHLRCQRCVLLHVTRRSLCPFRVPGFWSVLQSSWGLFWC